MELFNIKGDPKKELLSLNNTKIVGIYDENIAKSPLHAEYEVYKQQVFQKIEQQKKKREGELRIGYLGVLSLTCCVFCSRKNARTKKLFEKSQEEVAKYLNFLDILKMLQEFAKLKLAMLNDDQLKVFACSSKPIISNDENFADPILNKFELRKNNVSLPELFEAYLNLSRENDHMNSRLVNLFDEDIKLAFDLILKQKNIIK